MLNQKNHAAQAAGEERGLPRLAASCSEGETVESPMHSRFDSDVPQSENLDGNEHGRCLATPRRWARARRLLVVAQTVAAEASNLRQRSSKRSEAQHERGFAVVPGSFAIDVF